MHYTSVNLVHCDFPQMLWPVFLWKNSPELHNLAHWSRSIYILDFQNVSHHPSEPDDILRPTLICSCDQLEDQKTLIFSIWKYWELFRHARGSSNTAYISIIFNACCDTPWRIHGSKKLERHRLLSICLHASLLFKTKHCSSWFYILSWFFPLITRENT